MKRRKSTQDKAIPIFPSADQAGAIMFIASGIIDKIPVPGFVAEARDACAKKWGFSLVAIVEGDIAKANTTITIPDSYEIEYPIRGDEGSLRTIYLHVIQVEPDDSDWNEQVASKIFSPNEEEREFALAFSKAVDNSIAQFKKTCRVEC